MLSRVILFPFAFTIVGLSLAEMSLGPIEVAVVGGAIMCLLPGLLALALPAGGLESSCLHEPTMPAPARRAGNVPSHRESPAVRRAMVSAAD